MCSQESHNLLVLSPQWSSLKSVGLQPTYDEPGQPQFLELRNCSCGSTLARPVEQARPCFECARTHDGACGARLPLEVSK